MALGTGDGPPTNGHTAQEHSCALPKKQLMVTFIHILLRHSFRPGEQTNQSLSSQLFKRNGGDLPRRWPEAVEINYRWGRTGTLEGQEREIVSPRNRTRAGKARLSQYLGGGFLVCMARTHTHEHKRCTDTKHTGFDAIHTHTSDRDRHTSGSDVTLN